jgi:putative ABC transport system permease protein
MSGSLGAIPILNLLMAFIPVLVVIVILYRWSVAGGTAIYATVRMLVQLLLVGYVLTWIFESNQALVVVGVLSVMLLAASWISLRPLQSRNPAAFLRALVAISLGGVLTLILVSRFVLSLQEWYEARFVIPLAGMIFANSMNAVSLAAERFHSESERGLSYVEARKVSLRAAMIPLVNSLLAVGIVSLPGMMTGQILSGVEPLIAVRYQVMVMCMVFGSAGISAAAYLVLIKPAAAQPGEVSSLESA